MIDRHKNQWVGMYLSPATKNYLFVDEESHAFVA